MTEINALDELNRQIEVVSEEWKELGLNPGRLHHNPESLWVLKLQVQAMMNLLILKGILTEDELNLEYKRLQLNDMQILKDDYKEQKRQALLAPLKFVDGDGREFKP